jgi:predicted GNAT family N-acyltransferase
LTTSLLKQTVTSTGCLDEILALRTLGYSTRQYNVEHIETMADEFDHRSEHVTLWAASEPVATARLTSGPHSVFETWSQAKADIPTGSHVADVSRVAVRPDMRRLGLSSIVVLGCLRRAAEKQFRFVVGASMPGGALFNLMKRIGFTEAGNVVELYESQGQRVDVQLMVATPSQRLVSVWCDMEDECHKRLALNGFSI